MSLPLLAAMVVVGIAAIVIAVHVTGGSRPSMLVGEDDARQRFAEDFPDEEVAEVVLTADRRTAFLMLASGRTGVVHGIGDRFLTRRFSGSEIAAIEAGDELGFAARFRDFTWKGGEFRFLDAAAAATVRRAFQTKSTIGTIHGNV